MSESNPVILWYRVWYDLSIHFVSRGLEFHQQEFFPASNRRHWHRICCSLTWNKAKVLAGWIISPGDTSWQTHVCNKRSSLSSRILARVVRAYTRWDHFSLQSLLQRSTCQSSVSEYLVSCKTLQTVSFSKFMPIFHEILAVHEITQWFRAFSS